MKAFIENSWCKFIFFNDRLCPINIVHFFRFILFSSVPRFRFSVSSRRISPSCAEIIRSVAYICGIYCHSVRTLHGAPTSPRRGLFATSSAIPGIVEGVYHCAAAIPCVPRRYPLSAFRAHIRTHIHIHTPHTYIHHTRIYHTTQPRARKHTYKDATFLLFVVATTEFVVAIYRRPTYIHTHVHTCPPPLFQPSTTVPGRSSKHRHHNGEYRVRIDFARTCREVD